jgi:hypothetical protein
VHLKNHTAWATLNCLHLRLRDERWSDTAFCFYHGSVFHHKYFVRVYWHEHVKVVVGGTSSLSLYIGRDLNWDINVWRVICLHSNAHTYTYTEPWTNDDPPNSVQEYICCFRKDQGRGQHCVPARLPGDNCRQAPARWEEAGVHLSVSCHQYVPV